MHLDITPFVLSHLVEIDLDEHKVLKQLIEAFSTISVEWKTDIGGSIQQHLTFSIIEYLKMNRIVERVDEKIEKGTLYIQKHLGKEMTLEEISDYCGYHPKYFIRLFKASMGVTPHQFLVSCRMKKALSMLLAGTSVKEVAENVGYKESKNFSRAFRQKYGMTPSQVNTIMKDTDRI
jgi:AraC-like DNA-binding protein